MKKPFGRSDDVARVPRSGGAETGVDGDNHSRSQGEQQLAACLDEVARLDGFFRTMNEDYGARLLELENLVADLRRRVSQLERNRIGGGREKISASTVLHDEYREIAARLEAILDQYVLYLAAVTGSGDQGRDPEAGRRIAEVARGICEALFVEPVVGRDAMLDIVRRLAHFDEEQLRLAMTVAEEVGQLRRLAREKGLEHSWSFDADIGGLVDSDLQKTFGSCDPAGSVRLVVFPALLVENIVFMRQRVYTT